MIKLSSYTDKKVRSIRNLHRDIREHLGEELFTIQDFQTLQFRALSQISLVSKSVKNEKASIESAIRRVMKYLGLSNIRARIKNYGDNEDEVEIKIDIIKNFNEWILGFDSTPHEQLTYLNEKVLSHLNYINSLINQYEKEPIIQSFKEKNKHPVNHEQRIFVDFYKRCTKERELILDYYLNKVKERAIQKANTKPAIFKGGYWDHFYDFPYKSSYSYATEYFDHTKINEVNHRLRDTKTYDDDSLDILYQINKEKFYKELFKLKSVQEIFNNIFFYTQHIPAKNDRKEIFLELQRLFKGKRWMAFFALALPQVEGLFTDMLDAINPNAKGKSLTEKVEMTRPSYFLSENYFDYYQYSVSMVRNRFMHTGYEENFKLKSYDLLVDIEHLLNIYYELDNSLVKINRLIKQANPMDFVGYAEFAKFFDLIEKLHPSQKKELKDTLNNFIKTFLINYCQLDYIFQLCIENAENINRDLVQILPTLDNPITFRKLNSKQKLLEDFSKNQRDFLEYNTVKMEEVELICKFYKGVKKFFANWQSEEKHYFINRLKETIIFFDHAIFLKNEILNQPEIEI